MNKAWIVSSLLGIGVLALIATTVYRPNLGYQFLDGATNVASNQVHDKAHGRTRVEVFDLHEPFDTAWGAAESELCTTGLWHMGAGSSRLQTFVLKGKASVALARGSMDNNQDILDGTDNTDTYVVVRTFEK